MKSFKEFRREWILNPSKEMIIESEICSAYDRYKLNLLTNEDCPKFCKCGHSEIAKPNLSDQGYDWCINCNGVVIKK